MRSSICVSDIKLSRVDLGEISGEERVSSEERKRRGREGRRKEKRREGKYRKCLNSQFGALNILLLLMR